MEAYPDIEIYLANADLEALNAWLGHALGAPPLASAGKHRWRTQAQHDGHAIAILLVVKAADASPACGSTAPTRPGRRIATALARRRASLAARSAAPLAAGSPATIRTASSRSCPMARKQPSTGRIQGSKREEGEGKKAKKREDISPPLSATLVQVEDKPRRTKIRQGGRSSRERSLLAAK